MKNKKPLKVLIVEDSEQDTTLIIRELKKGGYSPVYLRVSTAQGMNYALDNESWDVVIADYLLPGFNSMEALKLLHKSKLDLPFIIISGQMGEDIAVAAIKAGASDYIMKGHLERLVPAIQNEMFEALGRRERVQREFETTLKDEELVQRHRKYLTLIQRLPRILSEAKDFDTLLKKALEYIMRSFHFSSGALFTRDTTNGEYNLGTHSNISLEFAEFLNKMFAFTRQAPNIKETESSVLKQHLLDKISVIDTRKYGLQSEISHFVVTLPLKSGGKTVAAVILPSNTQKRFSQDEKKLLHTIGSQIGIIIENVLLIRKMSQLSITDELTKLYNRRHFYEILKIEIERSQRYDRSLSLVILDVDGFKEVNDKFGHMVGDSVLQSLASTMTSHLRRTDTPFRYGGDEFAVILPETDSSKAKSVIERIKKKWLHIPKTNLGLENPLGFSAGIVEYPRNAKTLDSIVFLADAALYYSKRSGKYKSTSVSEMGEIPSDMLAGASLEQVYALSATVDSRETYGYEHSRRVAEIAEAIGKVLGLSDDELADLHGASLLHDIGKIGISDVILNKSERLSPLEREIVKKHSAEGEKIVGQIKKISNLAILIRHHHEWYDGTGYPDGLKGQEIPLCSRIISIADAYDIMITRRSYRNTLSRGEAIIELERCSGTQFDPEIIRKVSLALFQKNTTDD